MKFNRNAEKVFYMMRLNDLQRVYRMLLHEREILDMEYICSEIEKTEKELDDLDNYAEGDLQ